MTINCFDNALNATLAIVQILAPCFSKAFIQFHAMYFVFFSFHHFILIDGNKRKATDVDGKELLVIFLSLSCCIFFAHAYSSIIWGFLFFLVDDNCSTQASILMDRRLSPDLPLKVQPVSASHILKENIEVQEGDYDMATVIVQEGITIILYFLYITRTYEAALHLLNDVIPTPTSVGNFFSVNTGHFALLYGNNIIYSTLIIVMLIKLVFVAGKAPILSPNIIAQFTIRTQNLILTDQLYHSGGLTLLCVVLLYFFVADKVAYALTQGLKIGQIFPAVAELTRIIYGGSTTTIFLIVLHLISLQYDWFVTLILIVGELKIQQYAMKADCEHGWMSKELEEVCKLEASHIMQAEMLSNLRYHTSVIISLDEESQSLYYLPITNVISFLPFFDKVSHDHQAYEEVDHYAKRKAANICASTGARVVKRKIEASRIPPNGLVRRTGKEQKVSTHEFRQLTKNELPPKVSARNAINGDHFHRPLSSRYNDLPEKPLRTREEDECSVASCNANYSEHSTSDDDHESVRTGSCFLMMLCLH
ncbi:hypothetical protein ACJX0J_006826, partial [Zea mays]